MGHQHAGVHAAFEAPQFLEEQYERLGKTDGERQLAYRDLFRSELDSSELGEIRVTVNRGWPLGRERFKDEIERAFACAIRPPKRGRPTRSIMPQGKPFG